MQTEQQPSIQSYEHIRCAIWQQDALSGEVIQQSNAYGFFPAASLAKLYIVAATLSLAEHGEVDLHQPLRITWEEFREGNYGTGSIRRTFPLTYLVSRWSDRELIPPIPLQELLYRAVHDSDNIAALKVANEIGRERIQRMLHDWGLDQTTIYAPQTGQPNTTTAENMGRFLLEFGRGFLVKDEHFNIPLLRWMKERRISNQEGQLTQVRYRDGQISQEGFAYVHSAGYLIGARERQVFVVLTQDQTEFDYDSTYPQQETVRSTVAEMAYSVV